MPAQAQARPNNVADLDQPLRALSEAEREARTAAKPRSSSASAEKIADHATAIVSQACTAVLDRVDELQKRLDELRSEQTRKMERAEEAIRDAMAVADSVNQTCNFIDKQISDFRSSDARTV